MARSKMQGRPGLLRAGRSRSAAFSNRRIPVSKGGAYANAALLVVGSLWVCLLLRVGGRGSCRCR